MIRRYLILAAVVFALLLLAVTFEAGRRWERTDWLEAVAEKDREMDDLRRDAAKRLAKTEAAIAAQRRDHAEKLRTLLHDPSFRAWHDTPLPAAAAGLVWPDERVRSGTGGHVLGRSRPHPTAHDPAEAAADAGERRPAEPG